MMVEPVTGINLSGHAVPYMSVQENKQSGNNLQVYATFWAFSIMIPCLFIFVYNLWGVFWRFRFHTLY